MSQSVGSDYRYGEDNLQDGPEWASEDMPVWEVITITVRIEEDVSRAWD
jgi:hypothetical protein